MRFRDVSPEEREIRRAVRPVVGDIVSLIGIRGKKYKVTAGGMKFAYLENVDNPAEKVTAYFKDMLKDN